MTEKLQLSNVYGSCGYPDPGLVFKTDQWHDKVMINRHFGNLYGYYAFADKVAEYCRVSKQSNISVPPLVKYKYQRSFEDLMLYGSTTFKGNAAERAAFTSCVHRLYGRPLLIDECHHKM